MPHYQAKINIQRVDPPKPAIKDRYGNEETPATYGTTEELGSVVIQDGDLERLKISAKAHLDLITDLETN